MRSSRVAMGAPRNLAVATMIRSAGSAWISFGKVSKRDEAGKRIVCIGGFAARNGCAPSRTAGIPACDSFSAPRRDFIVSGQTIRRLQSSGSALQFRCRSRNSKLCAPDSKARTSRHAPSEGRHALYKNWILLKKGRVFVVVSAGPPAPFALRRDIPIRAANRDGGRNRT